MVNTFLKTFKNREKEVRKGDEYRLAFVPLDFSEESRSKQGGLFMSRFSAKRLTIEPQRSLRSKKFW